MTKLPILEGYPPVIAFVGYSGSGKTTLLATVIRALKERGLRVGVIKHSAHRGIEENPTGSDTQRFWTAGADVVALVTPDQQAVWRRFENEPTLPDVLGWVGMGAALECDRVPDRDVDRAVDLILIEGYKRSGMPKVEVIRAACYPQPIEGLQHRLASVTDLPALDLDCPTFGFGEIPALVDWLLVYADGWKRA